MYRVQQLIKWHIDHSEVIIIMVMMIVITQSQ